MDAEPSVAVLVAAARAGDDGAWGQLVERYAPLVLSVVRRHRLQGDDADDVAQTLWLRLVEHLESIREPEALPGWIVTTARHECLRLIKAHQRSQPFDPQSGREVAERADSARVDEDLLDAERHEALLAAFAELPDRQRALLALLVTDPPPSYAEISRRTGIPVGSIGPTRARALERVRASPGVHALLEAAAG